MEAIEFGYERPRAVADNIWEIRGEWKNKFGRRMTVVRLSDKRLMIHNAIRLIPRDLEWLSSLGTVAFIVAPNTFHCSDAGWMRERFPAAELFVPKQKLDFFAKQGLQPKDVNLQFPADLADEVKCIPMRGTRMEEAAFIHVASGTLILCDLAFNMGDVFTGFEKFVMKWNKVGGQFGPSRLTKIVFANDRQQLLNAYKSLLSENFDRVIVNHGDILETDGKRKLKAGIERIFGPV
ncbi:MAG: DUF4336 domain-containing protein [Bdellovibrionaceae bacterium]|nr:DUF4336 domain-containing protein [Pseudobdellovibrionaceae bacterium]